MKIVYCIPSLYNSGGMERVLCQKVNYLAEKKGWDITIITTSQKDRPPFYIFSSKITLIDIDIDYEAVMMMPLHKRIYARLKAKKLHRCRLEATLKQIRPDITVSMFTHEMAFLPDINDGSKKVLELHFSKSFRELDGKSNHRPIWQRALNRILDYTERRHIGKYDRFVVLSHRDKNDWGEKYNNIVVISNPSTFQPIRISDSRTHKVLAMGRLCAQKGFDNLIRSWASLPASLRDAWHLDIVGSGPHEEMLTNLIHSYKLSDTVSILPPTSDVESLFLSHSIFAFPSRYEGFGLALMEAMSFGLAAVATDCPCGPSELIENESSGFLVPNEDTVNFTLRLQQLMENETLRKTIGQQASQTITTKFSENLIMQKWTELFEPITKA